MKRMISVLLLLCLVLGLLGCGAETAADTRIQIGIMETAGCTVENNGQWVVPGGSAVFSLTMEEGYSLAEVDYEGDYTSEVKDGKLLLTLEDVQYPARVNVKLTNSFCTIAYDPNGAEGDVTVKTYDRSYHLRPNTDTGTDLFTREGYTLTCWNTEPDGSGTRVGLGSRVTVEDSLTLYAQWEKWSDVSDFEYTRTRYGNITIDGYNGGDETVVIPGIIDGYEVTAIAYKAFDGSSVRHVVIPHTMERIAGGAFTDCPELETVTVFDNIRVIYDSSFTNCENLRTLYINAIEAPWGADFRKESLYADKIDLLILAQDEKKMVFYGGCSVWYNLDGGMMDEEFGSEYTILNMGLNGTINSAAQMQILEHYLGEGDIFVHTLELSSKGQMMIDLSMGDKDDKLWCGLEYNYDLFTLVDLRTITGGIDSFLSYLEKKKTETDYLDHYVDTLGNEYLDEYGCVPFERTATRNSLADYVYLNPDYVNQDAMATLESYYQRYQDLGVTVYVSYACVNMDEVAEEEKGNVELMDSLVRYAIGEMDGPVLISTLSDFLFEYNDFYDTNYHLLTAKVRENTAVWLRDLRAQMVADGLWEE